MDRFLVQLRIGHLVADAEGGVGALGYDHVAFAEPCGVLLIYVLVSHLFLLFLDIGVSYVFCQDLLCPGYMSDDFPV